MSDVDYKAKFEQSEKEKEEIKKKLEEVQKNLDDAVKFHNETMQLFQDASTELGFVAKARKFVPKQQ